MTTTKPALLSTLGKLVTIGALGMYVRRCAAPDLFEVTLVQNNDENVSGFFLVKAGTVTLLGVDPGLLMVYGGGSVGRAALRNALQSALKVPQAPAPVSELEAARAAWKAHRTLANARRFNKAFAASQAR